MRSQFIAVSTASLLVFAAACGSDSSGPKIGPPARVEIVTSPTTSGQVKSSVGTFAVKVSDASGQAVSGVAVTFSATGGVSLSPNSATTDALGTARTTVTLGTIVGASTVSASVSGVTANASVALQTGAGAISKLTVTPATIRLNAIGDTASITTLAEDDFANTVTGSSPIFTVADPTLVSVDANGVVRALRVGGTTNVTATASGFSGSVGVTVLAPGASPCTGVSTPLTLAVGGMATVSGGKICIGGGAATSDYTIVAFNSSLDAPTMISATIVANGVTTPPATSRAPSGLSPLATRSPSGGASVAGPVEDVAFHSRLMSMSRQFNGKFGDARAARNARLSSSSATTRGGFALSPSRTGIPVNVAVNDLVSLNTNGNVACTAAQMRTFRVAAIGDKAIVLADTANPKNGFTDADYQRFAARFDTLVYPLDVTNFGAPSDYDGNGKVAILFTKEVNALTPANSGSYVGGFFFVRDLFPKTNTAGFACGGSNEGEMFYMLVPDPTGAVNGNRHTLGFVDTITTNVLAHEFEHLINAGRRLIVNTTASVFEEHWLDEGLAHSAEELLYWRESGKQPRQNLDDAAIRVNSRPTYPMWKADASSNFGRLIDYLENPGGSSMIDDPNELSTRGAVWSFLRYAVDRTFPSDNGVWYRLVNSDTSGVESVRAGLQMDPTPLFGDWALANYLDDLGINNDPKYKHLSWNFRDIYAHTFLGIPNYPLALTSVSDNVVLNVQVKGASAGYYRFAVAQGKEALLTFASGQGAPNSSFVFTVIRTK